jgi:hypothetical protein
MNVWKAAKVYGVRETALGQRALGLIDYFCVHFTRSQISEL